MPEGIDRARQVASSLNLRHNFGRPMDSEITAAQLLASIAVHDQLMELGKKLDTLIGGRDG